MTIHARPTKRTIRIEGNAAYVPLTNGYEAMIDANDVPLVSGRNWAAQIKGNTVYAFCSGSGLNRRMVYLHRVLMGEPNGLQVDHIDGNGLNNHRANLRAATPAENRRNQRLAKHNTSGFKGVTYCRADGKWMARIKFKGKSHFLGLHESAEKAHAAYAKASAEMHGEFGRLA